ncbi:unnamed protein product [Mytilus edulis]|uniref:CCHC-type domain-containing protein n=1 Tax=Mytilus edulis TaxID=6550 RepID=A0A8S3PWH3_MYTED|nr:unnamed protein product [Mytilus edulis]
MSTESSESDTDIGEEIAHEVEEPQINMAAAAPSLIPFPQKLDLDGNIATNWRKFKRTWNNYEIASGLSEKDAKLRTATLLTCVGSDAMDIFDGFAFEEENDRKDITKRRQYKHDKQSDNKKFPKKANNCDYCGRQCEKGKCPAYGKQCNSCGKYNHFSSQCRQGKYMKRRYEQSRQLL